MTNIANLQDHMAYSCKCGCVDFNLLKSGNIECVSCGGKITDSEWGLMPEINQKPVAWRWGVPKLKQGTFEWRYSLNKTRPDSIPLYTTPPQRTWVGLMRGVRVDGDTVVISVKGGNDAARQLCGALIEEMNR